MASLSKMLDKCIAVTKNYRHGIYEDLDAYIYDDLIEVKKEHARTGDRLYDILARRAYLYSAVYRFSIQSGSRFKMEEGFFNKLQAAQLILKTIYTTHPFGRRHYKGDSDDDIRREAYGDELTEFQIASGALYKTGIKYCIHNKNILIKNRQTKYAEILHNKKIISTWTICCDKDGDLIEEKAKQLLISPSRTFKGEMRLISLKKGNYRCAICGRTNKESPLEIDHIKPWSKGGLTCIANSRVLCKECNIAVSNKQTH